MKMFSLPAGTCVDLCLPVICGKTKQVFFSLVMVLQHIRISIKYLEDYIYIYIYSG